MVDKREGHRLPEFCRQGLAEVVSESRKKNVTTFGPPFWQILLHVSRSLYLEGFEGRVLAQSIIAVWPIYVVHVQGLLDPWSIDHGCFEIDSWRKCLTWSSRNQRELKWLLTWVYGQTSGISQEHNRENKKALHRPSLTRINWTYLDCAGSYLFS